MVWELGYWQEYRTGQVHVVLKRLIRVLAARGFRIEADFVIERKPLDPDAKEGGLFEALKDYERQYGVPVLIEMLGRGLIKLHASKDDDLQLELRVLLRCPKDTDASRERFKDLIATWVKENPLTFSERFFRLPKITEDLADRYLDNPLERVLKKTFGFHFQYKLLVSCPSNSAESERLRATVYRILTRV